MNETNEVLTNCDGNHVEMLARWCKARAATSNMPDDSPGEAHIYEQIEELSVSLATTPATTLADLIAQIEWFEEDLGMYINGNAAPAHELIFQTLRAGAQHVSADMGKQTEFYWLQRGVKGVDL